MHKKTKQSSLGNILLENQKKSTFDLQILRCFWVSITYEKIEKRLQKYEVKSDALKFSWKVELFSRVSSRCKMPPNRNDREMRQN